MKTITAIIAALSIALVGSNTRAQDQSADTNYVSKAEYLKLKEDHDNLKKEMDALKAQMQGLLKGGAAPQTEALSKQVQ